MTEENKQEVLDESQVQERESIPQEEEQIQPEAAKASVDVNWERANEVLRLQKQKIEELEARLSQIAQPKAIEEPDEFDKLDPEDYLTVAKAKDLAKKTASKEAQQAAKKIVEQYVHEQNLVQDESRMRSKYEDYDFVIDNYVLPELKNNPALAYKIQQSKNPAETAYKLGKLSDQYEESTMKKEVSPKAEKIMKNTSRPLSSSAASSHLKNQATDFSKMSKQDIWEMSQKYARGA